jgi:hypothetical protein
MNCLYLLRAYSYPPCTELHSQELYLFPLKVTLFFFTEKVVLF